MRPADFYPTQRVATPEYYGAVTQVIAMFEPCKRFDYVMTDDGVYNVLHIPEDTDLAWRLDKTPVCQAIDAKLGIASRNLFSISLEDIE